MKSIIRNSILAITALLLSNNSFAGNNNKIDTTSVQQKTCLEVLGIALDEKDQPINGVEVKLYKENDEMEWTEITSVYHHEHSFLFKLEANQYYTIEVSKQGFVTRTVGISTNIPSNVSLKQLFRYEFEVSLFKEKKGMDDFYMDFPVALISYDTKNDVFENNYAYTKHIKGKITEAKSQSALLKTTETK